MNIIDDISEEGLEETQVSDLAKLGMMGSNFEEVEQIDTDRDGRVIERVIIDMLGDDVTGSSYKLGIPTNKYKAKLCFQNQDPSLGINGFTNEQIIIMLIDRLHILQEKQSCKENTEALSYLNKALASLERRANKDG